MPYLPGKRGVREKEDLLIECPLFAKLDCAEVSLSSINSFIFTIILRIGIILPILQMRNPRLSEVTCLSKVTRRYSVGAGFKPRPVSAKRAPGSSITPFWKVSQFFVLTRCPAQDSLGDASKPKIISLPRLLSALWFRLVLPLGTLLYS